MIECKVSMVINGMKFLAGCFRQIPSSYGGQELTYGYQAWWPTPQSLEDA